MCNYEKESLNKTSCHQDNLLCVGIPYYKKTDSTSLQKAIESVIKQSLRPSEIHLIQDGEVSPGIEEVINKYLQLDNVKHIKIEKNSGLSYAVNLSILNTNCIYYARMDSDDVSHPDRFKKQVEFLEKNLDISILGTWALDMDDHSCIKVPIESKEIKDYFHFRNPFIHPTVMFRRDVFAQIGLYNIKYSNAQDTELWARVLKQNVGVANIPEALLYLNTKDIIVKRSRFKNVINQAKARYCYNTYSIKLNILKAASIIFRFLPYRIRKWGYKNIKY
jgi:glycosyltransferase involved in cell wall biosynthesis